MRNVIVNHSHSKLVAAAIALALLACLAFAGVTAPELPNPGHVGMSRQQQMQVGFQAAAQVYKQMPVLPDSSPETQYVRQLGAKLVATIPQQYTWPYEFHVVAQKEINAFALPGGPMFVNIGTIAAADNEAELAGVMGHEMSHVYMQHSARQMAKARKTGIFAGLAEVAAGAVLGGSAGELAQEGIQYGAQGLMLKYSRTDEAQADAVGAIILWKAGYNPQALADFFKKLEQQGGTGPQFLSDHPNPGNREEAIQKEIADWPPKQYQGTSPAFAQAKQHATGVRAYSAQEIAQGAKAGAWSRVNAQNGAVFKSSAGASFAPPASATAEPSTGPVSLSSVLPSSRLVTVNLGALTIAHPDNWQVIPPREKGEGVTIAPPAGLAGEEVGYGVVISGVAGKPGQRLDLDRVTVALARRFGGGGSRAQALASPQPLQVGGVQGRSVAMQSASPFPDANGQPQKERDWLVTVPSPDGAVFCFIFVAPEAQFDRFRSTFESMLQSLHF